MMAYDKEEHRWYEHQAAVDNTNQRLLWVVVLLGVWTGISVLAFLVWIVLVILAAAAVTERPGPY